MTLRKGLWSGPVKTRLHTVEKIYGWNEEGKEVMLFGNVRYGLVNGKEVVVEWAGRAELVFEGEEVKMGFYQVYLVCFSFLWFLFSSSGFLCLCFGLLGFGLLMVCLGFGACRECNEGLI